MTTDDALATLLADSDLPVAPQPAFSEQLWTTLASELASPTSNARSGWRGLLSPTMTPRRRLAPVLIVLALLLAGIASATYLGVRALVGADGRPHRGAAAAARLAEKEPVRIDLTGGPQGGNPSGGGGGFAIRLGTSRDAGSLAYSFVFPGSGTTASGQAYAQARGRLTLTGAKGMLVLQTQVRALGASGSGAVDGRDVWLGTWTVLSGTKAYAHLRGGGALVGIAGPGARVTLRLTGTLG